VPSVAEQACICHSKKEQKTNINLHKVRISEQLGAGSEPERVTPIPPKNKSVSKEKQSEEKKRTSKAHLRLRLII
jgi:hypothetical protein